MTPRDEYFSTSSLAGVQLHALHWGNPEHEKVVLLHGGGANAHWWDHIAPAIAQRFHVIALDFRGHGDADHPHETRVGALAEDLEALLEHLEDPPVRLVGHSMGGAIALEHACGNPNVRALVAVDVARGASKRSRRSARLALALKRSYATREDAIARYRFLPPSTHANEALRVHIATHSVVEEPDGRFGFKFDPRWFALPPRPRPDLERIGCPVLVLRGSESQLLTPEGADALAREFRDARLLAIEGAGHHIHLDQPDEFLAAVVPFLASAA